ncbi:MAG: YbaN family protein [Actinobacteria bacterium]|nr:YbaN family protein [Actinomycetota bacterium]
MQILNKKEKTLKKPVKILLIATGTFLIGVSIVGIFIPVLPTTPFLLLSAALYARSSKRFYNWLINNRILGRYIKNYREGKGIPVKAKITAISILWITIGYSAIFAIEILWVRILLVIIAIGVTVHIVRIKPKVENNTDISD